MIRITYTEKEGMLHTEEIVCNGNLLYAIINPSTCSYKIQNTSNFVFTEGRQRTLHMVKKAVKQAFIVQGASFVNEVRKIK